MQLVNATRIPTLNFPTSPNSTWAYPEPPGGTYRFLRSEFAGCIPSNITISSACCSFANGTFVTPNALQKVKDINSTELASILNAKYPNRNNSGLEPLGGFGSYATNENYIQATNASSSDGYFNWCLLPFNPMSTTPLRQFTSIGFQSGDFYGNTPESVIKWMQCFNQSVPAADLAAGRAAFVCTVNDLQTGGTIEGRRYIQTSAGEHKIGSGLGVVMIGLLLGIIIK